MSPNIILRFIKITLDPMEVKPYNDLVQLEMIQTVNRNFIDIIN